MNVNLKPSLIIQARLKVLHNVTDGLIRAFLISPISNTSEIIKKGILENQYFKKITVFFINEKKAKVGEASISIDWENHYIMASAEGKNLFSLDPNQSIINQVSEALLLIADHINIMKKELKIKETEVWFYFRDEIVSNNKTHEEALSYCGLTAAKVEPKWGKNGKSKITIKFSPNDLSELGIDIIHEK